MNSVPAFPGFLAIKHESRSFENFQTRFLTKHQQKSSTFSSMKDTYIEKIDDKPEPKYDKSGLPHGLTIIPIECDENADNSKEKHAESSGSHQEIEGVKGKLKKLGKKQMSDSFTVPEAGEVQRHMTSLSPFGGFSEVMHFRDGEQKNENRDLLNELLLKEDSTVLPFVKRFINKLKNSSSVRNLSQMKPITFKILSDSSYFFQEFQKKQEFREATAPKKCFLLVRNFYESKINQLKRNFLTQCFANFFLGNIMVFHPYHYLKILWDLTHLVIIISWFFYIPLIMAFEEIQEIDRYFSFSTFIFLIVDIFLSCNTSYFINGMVERNRKRIISHYFHYHFFLDAITVFPPILDQVLLRNFGVIDYLHFLPFHLVKFVFFLKIRTMQRIIHRINEKFLLKEKFQSLFSLFKVFFVSILVAHLFACFWYLTGKFSNHDKNSWLAKNNLLEVPWSTRYLYSMYWACITMMTVGYGDITPQNEIEIITCMVSVVLGCAVYAYNISSIGMILQDFNKENIEFEHNINIINQYMTRKNINRDLQMRIREYLRFIWKEENTQNLEDEQKIIGLLSNSLREELLIEAYGDILKKYPMFFANFTEKSLRKVVSIIKDIKLFPEEKIFNENEEDDLSIYFIMKGKVELFTDSGVIVKELSVGEHFGEIAFFSGKVRKLSAKSKDFTTLFSINRNEFIQVLMKNSDDFEKFCMIKDQMVLYENYFPLKLHCYSCNQIGHLTHQCPLIHFIADKEKIIKKYNFYFDQDRAVFSRSRWKHNSLIQKKKLEVSNKKIRAKIEIERAAIIKAQDDDFLSVNSSERSLFDSVEQAESNADMSPNHQEEQSDKDKSTIPEKTASQENLKDKKSDNDYSLNEIDDTSDILDKKLSEIEQDQLKRNSLPLKVMELPSNQNVIFRSSDNIEHTPAKDDGSDSSLPKNVPSIVLKKTKVVSVSIPERKKDARHKFNTEILKRDSQTPKQTNSHVGDLEGNFNGKSLNKMKTNSHSHHEETKTFFASMSKAASRQLSLGSQKEKGNHGVKGASYIQRNSTVPNADVMDNFDRVTMFKSYFPESNSRYLFESVNKRISRLRSLRSCLSRKKSFENKLSKYTFFPETMKQKMPSEIKKRVRKASKIRRRRQTEEHFNEESQYKKNWMDQSQAKLNKTKKTMLLSGRFFEEKFSDIVKYILRSPTLKKTLKSQRKKH